MRSSLYPKSQNEFATWLNTLATAVADDPAAAGVTEAQSDRLSEATARFQTAFDIATDPATRTRGAVLTKLAATVNAEREAKNIADIIRAAPEMSEEKLERYGIPARPKRSAGPVPTESVSISVSAAGPTTLRLRLADKTKVNNRKPASAIGAVVLYHLGEAAPTDTNE